MGKSSNKVTFAYPRHRLDPKVSLTFIETNVFQKSWREVGFTDEEFFALQVAIQANPKGPKVIKNTGGLRKTRFTLSSATGLRKATRVCYVYFPEVSWVLMVLAFPKNVRADLTEDQKAACRKLIEWQKKALKNGVFGELF